MIAKLRLSSLGSVAVSNTSVAISSLVVALVPSLQALHSHLDLTLQCRIQTKTRFPFICHTDNNISKGSVAASGVPETSPVIVFRVNQSGRFSVENVKASPSTSDDSGANRYGYRLLLAQRVCR